MGKDEITYINLKNKIKLIYVKKNIDYLIACVSILAGSNLENEKNYGIAHCVEHILFSNKIKNSTIMTELNKIGAIFNATTSHDQTNYYIMFDKKNVNLIIEALYTIYVENNFDIENLEKEKKIIKEEFNISNGSTNTMLYHKIIEDFYGKDKILNIMPIGDMDIIKNIKKKDIIDYKKFYVPELTSIILIGNYSETILNSFIGKFSKIPNNPSILKIVEKSKLYFKKNDKSIFYLSFFPKTKTNVDINIIFKIKNYKPHIVEFIIIFLNNVILFKKLRIDNGFTYSSNASTINIGESTLLKISCSCEIQYLIKVIDIIKKILYDLGNTELTDKEYEITLNKIIMIYNIEFKSPNGYLNWYKNLTKKPINEIYSPDEHLNKIKSTKKKDIKNTSNNLFNLNNSKIYITGKELTKEESPLIHIVYSTFYK
tara:strand:+ start:849 stop:2135 length:1287 start_codon:yes stop_codon:yes gene_type:complete